MDNKQRQMRERTVLASCFAAAVLAIKIISDFVGFNKLHPATPQKTFNEVVAEWPLLLGIGVCCDSYAVLSCHGYHGVSVIIEDGLKERCYSCSILRDWKTMMMSSIL